MEILLSDCHQGSACVCTCVHVCMREREERGEREREEREMDAIIDLENKIVLKNTKFCSGANNNLTFNSNLYFLR